METLTYFGNLRFYLLLYAKILPYILISCVLSTCLKLDVSYRYQSQSSDFVRRHRKRRMQLTCIKASMILHRPKQGHLHINCILTDHWITSITDWKYPPLFISLHIFMMYNGHHSIMYHICLGCFNSTWTWANGLCQLSSHDYITVVYQTQGDTKFEYWMTNKLV